MDIKEFNKRFFEDRDNTGRFMVRSFKTNIAYYVEPLDTGERRRFGDINPATGQIEGAYGQKHKGAIHPSESLITEANGLKNIVTIPAGMSPHAYIQDLDEQRYQEMLESGRLPA